MKPWERLWLVLTMIWGLPCLLIFHDLGMPAMLLLIGAPSAALYGLLWAVSGFFSGKP